MRLGRYPERWSFSPNASQGVVEMFVDGNWFPVCGYNWNLQAAAVACRDLGYGDPIKKYSWWYYQRHYAYEQLKKINCSGEEKALKDCPRSMYPCSSLNDITNFEIKEISSPKNFKEFQYIFKIISKYFQLLLVQIIGAMRS